MNKRKDAKAMLPHTVSSREAGGILLLSGRLAGLMNCASRVSLQKQYTGSALWITGRESESFSPRSTCNEAGAGQPPGLPKGTQERAGEGTQAKRGTSQLMPASTREGSDPLPFL